MVTIMTVLGREADAEYYSKKSGDYHAPKFDIMFNRAWAYSLNLKTAVEPQISQIKTMK